MRIKKEKKKKNIKAACLERAQQLPTLLRQQCWESLRACLAVVCKRMQQLPTSLRPVVPQGKNTTHKSL